MKMLNGDPLPYVPSFRMKHGYLHRRMAEYRKRIEEEKRRQEENEQRTQRPEEWR